MGKPIIRPIIFNEYIKGEDSTSVYFDSESIPQIKAKQFEPIETITEYPKAEKKVATTASYFSENLEVNITKTENGSLKNVPVELYYCAKKFHDKYNHAIFIDRTDGLADYDLRVLVGSFNKQQGIKLTPAQFYHIAKALPENIEEETSCVRGPVFKPIK